jgi:putative glutamine amidotransferase
MPPPAPPSPPLTKRRPLIGVTGPDRGGEAAWLFTWFALALAGASARHVTPRRPAGTARFDGLVVGGGADVDPRLYGQELAPLLAGTAERRRPLHVVLLETLLLPLTWLIRHLLARSSDERQDKSRDRLEMGLIAEAVGRRLPVLGICRGAQLLNVYFGGTLHQSLAGFYCETREMRSIRPRKQVRIAPESRLLAPLGKAERWVNSLHRQAVAHLGRQLRVAAADRNNIVQAIEHDSLPFVLGVQWHPEFLPQRRDQRAIFRALVRAAKVRMTEQTRPGRNA